MAEVEDIEPEEEKSGGGMLKIILVVLLVLLVGVGSVLGTLFFVGFFDDEIATIGIINGRDIFSIYSYVNHWDVSPPLSYILIYIGEKIFGFQYAPLLFLPLHCSPSRPEG